MDLWIRTQRRRLCQVIDISEPILDELDNIEGYCLYGRNLADSFIPLGMYKTEKRALEVLDEIQNKLKCKPLIMPKHNNNDFLNNYFDLISNTIYQMPKE